MKRINHLHNRLNRKQRRRDYSCEPLSIRGFQPVNKLKTAALQAKSVIVRPMRNAMVGTLCRSIKMLARVAAMLIVPRLCSFVQMPLKNHDALMLS
nr:hypothetical protein [Herpetosiphon llansteffanensis]